jgi:hypothetical protein
VKNSLERSLIFAYFLSRKSKRTDNRLITVFFKGYLNPEAIPQKKVTAKKKDFKLKAQHAKTLKSFIFLDTVNCTTTFLILS